jgi:hypothetical protein
MNILLALLFDYPLEKRIGPDKVPTESLLPIVRQLARKEQFEHIEMVLFMRTVDLESIKPFVDQLHAESVPYADEMDVVYYDAVLYRAIQLDDKPAIDKTIQIFVGSYPGVTAFQRNRFALVRAAIEMNNMPVVEQLFELTNGIENSLPSINVIRNEYGFDRIVRTWWRACMRRMLRYRELVARRMENIAMLLKLYNTFAGDVDLNDLIKETAEFGRGTAFDVEYVNAIMMSEKYQVTESVWGILRYALETQHQQLETAITVVMEQRLGRHLPIVSVNYREIIINIAAMEPKRYRLIRAIMMSKGFDIGTLLDPNDPNSLTTFFKQNHQQLAKLAIDMYNQNMKRGEFGGGGRESDSTSSSGSGGDKRVKRDVDSAAHCTRTPTYQMKCMTCDAPAKFYCTACNLSWYCSPEHQRDDWQEHSKLCYSTNNCSGHRRQHLHH